MKVAASSWPKALPILVAGDVVVFLLWVAVGLSTHRMYDSWLYNVVRIVTPFLIGWFAAAFLAGAYRLPAQGRGAFMGRSAVAWLVGDCVGLFLRATLFGSGFVPIFAMVTFVFTGLFLLGWRAIFAFVVQR